MSLEALRVWAALGAAIYILVVVITSISDGLDPALLFGSGPVLAAVASVLLLGLVQIAWFAATGAFL